MTKQPTDKPALRAERSDEPEPRPKGGSDEIALIHLKLEELTLQINILATMSASLRALALRADSPCTNGYCRSPLACSTYGYCRNLNE